MENSEELECAKKKACWEQFAKNLWLHYSYERGKTLQATQN